MAKRIIDYIQLVKNYDIMIETLEYDSMRSGGKAKLNSDALYHMQMLRDRYAEKIAKDKPKAAPVKKGGN
jgi:hypothetical protein